MAKQMRLISESEYQMFLKCKGLNTNGSYDNINENLSLLTNPKLPEDIKLGLYSSVTNKQRKRFVEGLEVQNETQKPKASKTNNDVNGVKNESNPTTSFNQMASQTEQPITNPYASISKVEEQTYLSGMLEHTMGRINGIHLLSILKNNPSLFKWNSHGQISFMNNPYDKRTNLKNIFTYLFRTVKVLSVPPGITRTYQILAMLKVSPGIIMNSDARKDYSNFYVDADLEATYHTGVTDNDQSFSAFDPIDPADKLSSSQSGI